MRVALAQINSSLCDFSGNRQKIIEYIERAAARRADVILFPESTLFGYHPMDLLERSALVEQQLRELAAIQKKIPAGVMVLIGAFTKNPSKKGKPFFNSAIALQKGARPRYFHKELLPTYDVFDDARHIEAGEMAKNIIKFKGKKFLITICEDIWAWPQPNLRRETVYENNPLKNIKPGSVDFVLNLSASPFYDGKFEDRLFVVRQTVKQTRAPMVYVNMVGAQDELIFDGGSFACDEKGKLLAHSMHFVEDLNIVDFETHERGMRAERASPVEQVRQALVLGIRDFAGKNAIDKVHLGVSGGIDSALVACLAVDALGPQNVSAYALPGPHSSELSYNLARKLAKNLEIDFKAIKFSGVYDSLVSVLDSELGKLSFGVMHENLQARLRGTILMAISNRDGSMLLNTSNKDELAVGYGTLYGDLCGGLSPIGDLLKGDVYRLAAHYNSQREIIPSEIISRPPTAELRPNQKDQDSLPPYDELDKSIVQIVEKRGKARNRTDEWLLDVMTRSEFKRWQSPPILKVREHSFGRGRRMPIAELSRKSSKSH